MSNVQVDLPISKKWSDAEEVYLIEQTTRNHDLLFGKMTGTGSEKIKKQKKDAWVEITNGLNALFTNHKRTMETVKKKYYNIKARSTCRVARMKRPPTGGGPMPKKASLAEETYLDLNEERPNVNGLEGGIDTDDAEFQIRENADDVHSCVDDVSPSTSNAQEENRSLDEINTCEDVQMSKSHKEKKGKGRRLLAILEEENLKLDNERLKQEIEKIKEEREILKLKKEVLGVEKAKLLFDMGIMPEIIQSEN